ncbi:TauD/TfdA family dioxygenase [Psychromonas sp. KJ10-2]|uniref:TauD/TfdA family dioxygenase n=1 Tax=Psychromonas sp. KJ10-2 TaxID=3391822 RepID=UPI0039B6C94E
MLKEMVETLKKQSVQEVHVSYEAANKLKNAFSNLRFRKDNECLNIRELLGNVVKYSLNDEVINTIQDFKSDDDQCALFIRGLSIDSNLCATPYNGYVPPSKVPLASAICIGVCQCTQVQAVSCQNENKGLLFRHVVPALKVRSNFILLDNLIAQLSRGVVNELCQPNFRITRPDSFGQSPSSRLPILVIGEDGVMLCRYDKENTIPLTESTAALVMLEAHLQNESLKQHVVYQPGNLLIIKNQRLLHSREGFKSRSDGAGRWLARMFGVSTLERIVPATPEFQHIGKN